MSDRGITRPRLPARDDEEARSAEEVAITLGLLTAVEAHEFHTQRTLAAELGVALGLANAYIRRCVKKGLIKVGQAPAKRYAYYLTPKGIAEKGRLTATYLRHSLGFLRRARLQCEDVLRHCQANGWTTLMLVGDSELAEIFLLCAADSAVEIVALIADFPRRPRLGGVPVLGPSDDRPATDAVVITAVDDAQDHYDRWRDVAGPEKVLFLPLQRLRKR